MAQHLLGYFGIDVLGAKKGRTGVLKIVEADGVGETRSLEDGLGGVWPLTITARRQPAVGKG